MSECLFHAFCLLTAWAHLMHTVNFSRPGSSYFLGTLVQLTLSAGTAHEMLVFGLKGGKVPFHFVGMILHRTEVLLRMLVAIVSHQRLAQRLCRFEGFQVHM